MPLPLTPDWFESIRGPQFPNTYLQGTAYFRHGLADRGELLKNAWSQFHHVREQSSVQSFWSERRSTARACASTGPSTMRPRKRNTPVAVEAASNSAIADTPGRYAARTV